tara:strand:- start:122 stop:490 length:369 start_codon:yes stop_codon:yes gene_type:complete
MSSSDALQHHQLALFIPAKELAANVLNWSSNPARDTSIILDEAQNTRRGWDNWGWDEDWRPGTSLYDRISVEGVRTPVEIDVTRADNPLVVEGAHRSISANDMNPDTEVPVSYVTEYVEYDE